MAAANLPTPDNQDSEQNDVLFIGDVARLFRVSRSTIERRRRQRAFPIPELPRIDNRPRWSRQQIEAFLKPMTEGARRGRIPGNAGNLRRS